MNSRTLLRAASTALVGLFLAGAASPARAAIAISTVSVGDVGNAAEYYTGFGRVNYAYRIGKYEVTAGQYAAFLNAVGATGSYFYTVATGCVNLPVNYVSFWDAARFANWLNNGQPTGAQGPGTTEMGAYTLTSGGISANTVTRNAGATWVVTSKDEWTKAGYYNAVTSSYYDYPTRSNTTPGRDTADASGNNANYYAGSGAYPIASGHYTTLVGQFQNSASPYGTFDQGGNVDEWSDDMISGPYRYIRGGWFGDDPVYMDVRGAAITSPTNDGYNQGFRVAQVPEPASIALLAFAGAGMLARRRGARGAV